MATQIRSYSANSGNSTTPSVSAPSGATEGDLMIVIVHANELGSHVTITDNNGGFAFTEDIDEFDTSGTNGGGSVSVFYRRLQSGDPTTYNFTISTSGRWGVGAICIQEPHASTIWDATPTTQQQGTPTTTMPCPSITTATANAIHLACVFTDGLDNLTTDTPAGYTKIINTASQNVTVAWKTIASPGATGGLTFTCSSSIGGGLSLAIPLAVGDRKGRISFGEFETPNAPVITYPQVQDITVSTGGSGSTFVVDMPATVNPGDLLLLFFALGNPGTPSGYVLPSGWTPIADSGEDGNTWLFCLATAAVGNEDGTTLTITLNASAPAKKAQLYRITNWFNSGGISADVVGLAEFQGTTTPNPPALNPSYWDIEPTLWIEYVAGDVSEYTDTSLSANYTNGLKTAGNGRNHMLSGRRENTVASEDPGPFATLSASGRVHVMTIAIRPAVTGDRSGRMSWAELETPPAPDRRGRIYWAEMEAPDVSKRGRISFVEFEAPDEPTNRKGVIRWAELEAPDVFRRGVISHAEFEVPNVVIEPPPERPFIILVEQDIAIELSLVADSTIVWQQDVNRWYIDLGTRNILAGVRRKIWSVRIADEELTPIGSFQAVNSTESSFWYKASNNRLYINPLASIQPNTRLVLARFKLYWSNYSIDFNGVRYVGRIILNPEDESVRFAVNPETMAQEPLVVGGYRVANVDANYSIDDLTKSYILYGQKTVKSKIVYSPAGNIIGTDVLANGIIGEINRSDSEVLFKLWN